MINENILNNKILYIIIIILLIIIYLYKNNYKSKSINSTEKYNNTIRLNNNNSSNSNTNNSNTNNTNNSINNSNNSINSNIKYIKCGYQKLQNTLEYFFNKYKFTKINENRNDWNLYIPCGYNYIETELNKIKVSNPNQAIYAIKGCDKIASKNQLWKIVSDYYGRDKASKLIPESFIINLPSDIELFKKHYKEGNIYLLKKNIQRKEGILILNDYNKIIKEVKKTKDNIHNYYNNSSNSILKYEKINSKIQQEIYTKNQNMNSLINNYKIIQIYINDLYIINKRKCNLRLYFLIKCKNGIKEAYLYNYGKCIYTNKDYKDYKDYKENSNNNVNSNNTNNKNNVVFNKEEHLTSYLLDQEIYNTHPESLNDLKNYLGNNPYNHLWKNIIQLFKNIWKAIKNEVCNKKSLFQVLTFQLFGADIIFTKNMMPYLLELNKGPSMKYMNNDDEKMKNKLTEDLFKQVHIIPKQKMDKQEFIKL